MISITKSSCWTEYRDARYPPDGPIDDEVVLRDGVLNIFRREEGGADLIFAEERALSAVGQFAGERSFTCAGKTCHQDDHAVESVAEAESSSTFSLRPSSR